MMKKLIMLVLLCHIASGAKHSLKIFITGSSGVPNIPESVTVLVVDDIQVLYCDSSNKLFEVRQDWAKTLFDDDLQKMENSTQGCFENHIHFVRDLISSLKQQFNHTEGTEDIHIIQGIRACELDENTEKSTGVIQFGYNGEDFIKCDPKTLTWIALKPEANIIKQRWDANEYRRKDIDVFLNLLCPGALKMLLDNKNISLQRTVLPSVSLLQKSPSSPVSCHATGFYPGRAMMFWRKDGEELHESMDHREILPNNDATFQMSVDLNVSSVPPEDWRRYDCMFQLSDGEDIIITKLNETVIRTNWREKIRKVLPSVSLLQKTPSSPVSCHATGFYPDRAEMVWRKDGEEIHEDVDHREILPNHDGTFQMSVDLNVSSVAPEDWRRYDCVFQLSGVDYIIKLNETVIRTNFTYRTTEFGKVKGNASDMMIPIIAALFVLVVLILIIATGFAVYQKKKGKQPTSPPGEGTELAEKLNAEST